MCTRLRRDLEMYDGNYLIFMHVTAETFESHIPHAKTFHI